MFSRDSVYSFRLLSVSVALFTAFRLLTFLLAFDDPFSLPRAQVLRAFLLGVRFDANVLLFLFIPVILASHLPRIGAGRCRATRVLVSWTVGVALSLSSLSQMIDIPNMRTLGNRFFIGDMEYLKDLRESFKVLVPGYNLPLYLAAWLSVCLAIAWLVACASRTAGGGDGRPRWYARVAGPVLMILALLVAGLPEFHTLRWGTAYFSQNRKLNELVMNGPYVLYYSYRGIRKEMAQGRLSGPAAAGEAVRKARELLSGDRFRFVDPDPGRILRELRGGAEFKPWNVVLVIMESFSAEHIGALGAGRSLTPFFDRLAGDGLLFTGFYANGTRTNKGLSALLFSYPDFLPNEALIRSFASRHRQFSSLAVLLKKKNYQTYFATGGAIGFDNMEGMLHKNGFDRLVGYTDFNLSSKRADRWTVPDEVTFDEAHRQFSEFARHGKPFFGVILTLSNHTPYVVPEDFSGAPPGSPEMSRAFLYSDWALGRFMERAGESAYFDNTVFVITGDHGVYGDFPMSEGHRRFRTPLLLYAPKLLRPGVSAVLGSQLDLLPTLVDLLAIREPFESFGRSLFSGDGERFSISKDGLMYHLLRDGYYIQTDLAGGEPLVFPGPPGHRRGRSVDASPERIISDSRLLVQATFLLLGK